MELLQVYAQLRAQLELLHSLIGIATATVSANLELLRPWFPPQLEMLHGFVLTWTCYSYGFC